MITTRGWARSVFKVLLLACLVVLSMEASAQIWTVIAIDPKGDGSDSALADAAQLCYRYDKEKDMLWFRISLWGVPNKQAFGINIALDTGADDSAKMNWWGANRDFKFDKLVTAWVTGESGNYRGMIGVADAAGAHAKNFNNLVKNNLQIRVEGDSIVLGMKRTDVTDKMKMRLIAAVGSDQRWNDDIPNSRSALLDLSSPKPARGLREIDLSRNNFRFPSDYKTLGNNEPPLITKKGTGPRTLVLIPGVYSGKDVFDGFIARNQSQYKLYVLTPPGLNGTPARALPSESTSYGEFAWTRLLERDILNLIAKEKLDNPVIVCHGFPGSLAAEELADQHPEALAGIIDLASIPLQAMPSMNGKAMATPDERIEVVDQAWAQKWFKYVTPETWESNNYQAEMFANNPERAEQIRRQIELAPLPVKIRYLAEFMASDHTSTLANLQVPLLALRPGFNQKFLADPNNAYYKNGFEDAWDPLANNPRIRLLTIPNARALILDDQPKLADEAISAFVRETIAAVKKLRDVI